VELQRRQADRIRELSALGQSQTLSPPDRLDGGPRRPRVLGQTLWMTEIVYRSLARNGAQPSPR
jgi:hypothetical protein